MEHITGIAPGDVFTHKESGNTCVVVCAGMMKQEFGPWEDSVTYRNLDGVNPAMVFTRSMVAFKELFVRGAKEA